jgi:hypothetical protein
MPKLTEKPGALSAWDQARQSRCSPRRRSCSAQDQGSARASAVMVRPAGAVPSRRRETIRGERNASGCGNGMRIQTAQSFERQGSRPSTLGHYGRRRRVFTDRILSDRSLANRTRRRRRRLPARQIGSGGSTQHRKGCGRCGEHLQHDVAPLEKHTAWSERSARSKWQNAGTETIRQRKAGFFNAPNSLS